MISYKELKEDALNLLQSASVVRYTWWTMALSFIVTGVVLANAVLQFTT